MQPTAKSLRIGVAQTTVESTLGANLEKLIGLVAKAADAGCRVVHFPEDAVTAPSDTPPEKLGELLQHVSQAAIRNKIYVIFAVGWGQYRGPENLKRMYVIGPDGGVLLDYPKTPKGALPKIFHVDGVPCHGVLCSDRWIRAVEELPVMEGSRILFECSNGPARGWVPELGWMRYVPSAHRNGIFVVVANTANHRQRERQDAAYVARHGHSAIISPAGELLARADGEADILWVADIDPRTATRAEAIKRFNHPLFESFWRAGLDVKQGQRPDMARCRPLTSRPTAITLAAAQMASSRDIERNVARMEAMITAAARGRADFVVFPELCVTGATEDDVREANDRHLRAALTRMREAAKQHKIGVAFGMPWRERGKCYNAAFVVDRRGELLTRYDQIVVGRPDLFDAGRDPASMWFRLKGVPGVVTIGHDAQWTELAELAAMRGAQLHAHLAYDTDVSGAGTLLRQQRWIHLGWFGTFTATVNAASPAGLGRPSAAANGGSALWDDFVPHHTKKPSADVDLVSQYSANRIARAGEGEGILFATRTTVGHSLHYKKIVTTWCPQMRAWYEAGMGLIAGKARHGRSSAVVKRPRPPSGDRRLKTDAASSRMPAGDTRTPRQHHRS